MMAFGPPGDSQAHASPFLEPGNAEEAIAQGIIDTAAAGNPQSQPQLTERRCIQYDRPCRKAVPNH